MTILLVDDDDFQATIFGTQLAHLGYQNVILAHGACANARFGGGISEN